MTTSIFEPFIRLRRFLAKNYIKGETTTLRVTLATDADLFNLHRAIIHEQEIVNLNGGPVDLHGLFRPQRGTDGVLAYRMSILDLQIELVSAQRLAVERPPWGGWDR